MNLKEQILVICDLGKTSTPDCRMVQRIVYEMDFYEFVVFIKEYQDLYARFIFMADETFLSTSG